MMNVIKPLQIEDVVSVPRAHFEKINCVYSTKKKQIEFGASYDRWVRYRLRLEPTDDAGYDINFVLFYDYSDVEFGMNLEFTIPSASVNVKVIEPSTPFRAGSGTEKREERLAKLCSIVDLRNPEKTYFEDGQLKIHMKATILQKNYQKRTTGLGSMLWHRDNRDFTISVGKENEPKTEFKIHQLVLETRSPVFQRMLEHDMQERNERKLCIIDFIPEVVETVVAFCYDQEELEGKSCEVLIGILMFAEKYDIQDLKKKIEHALSFYIYRDTICQIANASILANSDTLKAVCSDILTLYIKNGTSFEHATILDKEFSLEMIQRASGGSKE